MCKLLPPASPTVLVTLSLAFVSAPLAAETFQPREGCTHVVTIQSAGCYVRNVVTCPKMGSGLLVYGSGKDGTVVATAFDEDGATMFLGPQNAGTMLKDKTDLFSLAALKATGADTYDYTMAGRDGVEAHYVGTATLTGETVEVDGRKLEVIATKQTVTPPGGAAVVGDVTSYLDPELNFVLTSEVRDAATGKVTVLRTPIDYLFPGEEGTLAAEPIIGCEG